MNEEEIYAQLLEVSEPIVSPDERTPPNAKQETDSSARVLSDGQASFLADVHVPVSVELGVLEISAAELIDLLPGAELPFTIDEGAVVNLQVGRETVARATFVQRDAELGLQIVSVGTIN